MYSQHLTLYSHNYKMGKILCINYPTRSYGEETFPRKRKRNYR